LDTNELRKLRRCLVRCHHTMLFYHGIYNIKIPTSVIITREAPLDQSVVQTRRRRESGRFGVRGWCPANSARHIGGNPLKIRRGGETLLTPIRVGGAGLRSHVIKKGGGWSPWKLHMHIYGDLFYSYTKNQNRSIFLTRYLSCTQTHTHIIEKSINVSLHSAI